MEKSEELLKKIIELNTSINEQAQSIGLTDDYGIDPRIYENEQKFLAWEAIQEAKKVSYQKGRVKREQMRKQKQKAFLVKCSIIASAIVITASGLTAGISNYHNFSEHQDALKTIKKETGYMVHDNTHRANDPQYYFYDHNKIAQDILAYNGNRDMDSVLFSCYSNINYDNSHQMDEIFKCMSYYIKQNPEQYSENVIKACNYPTFADYLNSHNFESTEDYQNKMEEIVLAYQKTQENSSEVNSLLSELYPEDNDTFGGRK